MIQRIVLFLCLFLITTVVYGQFPQNPRNQKLGYSTTADYLVYLSDSIPTHTPSTIYDASVALDTTNNLFYIYDYAQSLWIRTTPLQGTAFPTDHNQTFAPFTDTADSTQYFYNRVTQSWSPLGGIYQDTLTTDTTYFYRIADTTFVYNSGEWVPLTAPTLSYDVVSRELDLYPGNALIFPIMQGATSGSSGLSGLVPAPVAGQDTMFLAGDGTWKPVSALAGGGDNWGSQVVQSDNTLQGDGTLGNLLGLNTTGASSGNIWKFDGVNWQLDTDDVYDGDSSVTNEIQTISRLGNDLNLSLGGGTVDLTPYAQDTQSVSYVQSTRTFSITGTDGGNSFIFPLYQGATGSVAGESGLVPAALAGEDQLFLRGDGDWATPNITVSVVSDTSLDGDGTSGSPLSVNQENIEDWVGAMIGDTTLITVTYDDVNGEIDYIVNPFLSNYTNDVGFLTSEVDGSVTNELQTLNIDSTGRIFSIGLHPLGDTISFVDSVQYYYAGTGLTVSNDTFNVTDLYLNDFKVGADLNTPITIDVDNELFSILSVANSGLETFTSTNDVRIDFNWTGNTELVDTINAIASRVDSNTSTGLDTITVFADTGSTQITKAQPTLNLQSENQGRVRISGDTAYIDAGDSLNVTGTILRTPSVGDALPTTTPVDWIEWWYFRPPTLSLSQSPGTTVFEIGTSTQIIYTHSTSNPASTTLSGGYLRHRQGGSLVLDEPFGAATSFKDTIQFTPLQSPTAAYEASTYNFRSFQNWSFPGEGSGTAQSNQRTIYGVYPVLYGMSNTDYSDTLSFPGLVLGTTFYNDMSKLVQQEGNKTVVYTGPGYIYYAIPKTWGDFNLSTILDHNDFNVTPAFDTYDVTISSSGLTNNWSGVQYKLYKLRTLTTTSGYDYEFIR